MIVCPRCSKENQDHYKFCLGCGAELPRDAEPRGFGATPPGGSPAGAPPPVAPPGPPPAQFGGAAGTPPPAAPPRVAGPPPAFGGPPSAPPGPPVAPPGPPVAPPGPPIAPPGPPPMAAPPMAPPGPPVAPPGPPMAAPPMAPPGPPAPAPAPAAGGFAGPMPAPAGPPPAVGNNGAPGAAPATVTCPQCGTSNNKNFKFCGSCGFSLASVASAPTPPAAAPMPSGGAVRGTLVLIRPDGTEGDSIPIDGRIVIGRETMPQFASDSYLSPRHASFHFDGSAVRVRDENSLNGIYMRIEREVPVELEDGAVFRIGQEIIRFQRLPEPKSTNGVELMGSPREGLVGRICLVTGRDTHGNAYAIPAEGLHLGRERGDILFPDDGYVSGLHARIHAEGGKVFLTDVGSSNGTFLRIRGEAPVPSGTMLLMGQQLFRLEY